MEHFDERLRLLGGVSDVTFRELTTPFLDGSSLPIFTSESDVRDLVDGGVITRRGEFDHAFLIALRRYVHHGNGNGIIHQGVSEEATSDFWESSTPAIRYAMMESILIFGGITFRNPVHGLSASDIDANLARAIALAKHNHVVSVPEHPPSYHRGINESYPDPEPRHDLLAMSALLIDLIIEKFRPHGTGKTSVMHLPSNR